MNTLSRIDAILDKTICPQSGLTVTTAGMTRDITESGNTVSVRLTAGFPASRVFENLLPLLSTALQDALPDTAVTLEGRWGITAHKTQFPGKGLRGVRNTVAVASGKGGVGKSMVTVNLATALCALGATVGILDADIYGPSIPLMLGESAKPEPTADGGYAPVCAHGLQAMSIGYLANPEQALLWRGPMLAKSLIQMLDLTRWEDLDYLLIDLPPGTGDIALSLAQKIPLTGVVVVTTPQRVATLDAEKSIQLFERTGVDVLGLVENMAWHACSQCGHQDAIFGQDGGAAVARQYGIPMLGRLPLHPYIRECADLGHPDALLADAVLAEPFMQSATNLAVAIARKPRNYSHGLPGVIVQE